MENDKKALWQRYSELTTADLIELQRSNRLPAADASMVDEMLEFRGVSKTARDNLKNSSVISPAAPAEATLKGNETTYKDVAPKPLLITLISIFALWKFVSSVLSMSDAKSVLSAVFFLSLAILSISLAYGLWKLKPWARGFMIFYSGLQIFLTWLFVLFIYYILPDDQWRPVIEELAQPRDKVIGNLMSTGIVSKILFLSAWITTVLYGLLLAYFFRPGIRRLFL